MNEIQLEEFLAHHGVKGMKWGVRHDRANRSTIRSRSAARARAKEDARFEHPSARDMAFIHNRAADKMNGGEIDRLNNDPRYKNANFTNDSPLRRQYYHDYSMTFAKHLQAAADELGTNASGTRKYHIEADAVTPGAWTIETIAIQHDALGPLKNESQLEFDAQGHIVKIVLDALEHDALTEVLVDDFLAHHGVKGMKWGVRKDRVAVGATRAGSATKKAAVGLAKKARGTRTSDVRQMSDAELQAALRRLNMERQYKSLKGQGADQVAVDFVRGVSKDVARETVKKALAVTVAAKLGHMGFKAFTSGVGQAALKITPPGKSFS